MYYIMRIGANADNNQIVPQVEDMGPGYNWDGRDSVRRISENVPLVQPPNLRAFHLDPLTVPTDVVSQADIRTRGLLVSPAFVQVLEKYQIQRHEPYPAEVVWKGDTLKYYWLHMIEKAEDSLDYANSAFRVDSLDGEAGETASIANSEDLQVMAKRLIETMEGQLKPILLTFLPGRFLNDFFCLDLPVRRFFVSSRLRDDLVTAHFTGFELVPTNVRVISS
jgi:hypothetical protein